MYGKCNEIDEKLYYGLRDFFIDNFTTPHFEYGLNNWNVCRYPLTADGERIIQELSYYPHATGVEGAIEYTTEIVATVNPVEGDTPTSIYFRLNYLPDMIHSDKVVNLESTHIHKFLSRFNQHLELLNQIACTESKLDCFKCLDFQIYASSSFKYDHSLSTISRMFRLIFNENKKFAKKIFPFTDHQNIFTQTTDEMDLEFFNRYYKDKIQEVFPSIISEELYALVDIELWSEPLKELVKMTYY